MHPFHEHFQLKMEVELVAIANKIWEKLGPGFSERVYHNAFEVELRVRCIPYETERIITIEYEGHNVGNLRADLIIGGKLIVELKSVTKLREEFENQAKNYMRLTGIKYALLINFPPVNGEIEARFFSSESKDDTRMVSTGGGILDQVGEAV
jgi:GxxExxY protein